jgi:hypothetical protein
MRPLLLLFCLAVSFGGRAEEAVPAGAGWGLPQLMQGLAEVKQSRGRFVEKKYLAVLDVPLTSSGTLSFDAPGHLEKHTLEPKDESLVLDAGVLTIENKARKQKHTLVVQQYPAVWAFVESIRSTLAGDQATLERFYKVQLKGDAAKWRMKLLPREKQAGSMVKEIVVSGRGNRVNSIEMLEVNGDSAIMTVTEERP